MEQPLRPEKAYKNLAFLNSPEARVIRVLAEFIEPAARFERLNIKHTIVFFGSARILPTAESEQALTALREEFGADADAYTDEQRERMRRAELARSMSRYYEDSRRLAAKLTEWSLSLPSEEDRFHICSGGGPGIMEAANLGARDAGGPSIGLNISLPFEQAPNAFQSPDLSFEFHYFFIRKFWFVNLSRALVIFPGGFGTCDEMFELLTLVQTGKAGKHRAIVLYGSEFWNQVLNFRAMADWGVISEKDLSLFTCVDNVDEAFEFLRDDLTKHHLEKDTKPKDVLYDTP